MQVTTRARGCCAAASVSGEDRDPAMLFFRSASAVKIYHMPSVEQDLVLDREQIIGRRSYEDMDKQEVLQE